MDDYERLQKLRRLKELKEMQAAENAPPSWVSDELKKSYVPNYNPGEFREKPVLNRAAEYIGETALNIPGDVIETGKEIGQAVLSPIDTVEGIGRLGNSAMQAALPQSLVDLMYQINPDTKNNKDLVYQLGGALKDKYIDNPAQTIHDRPVSTFLDVLGAAGLTKAIAKPVLKTASKGAGKLHSALLTHTGPESLNVAASAGYKGGKGAKTFLSNLRDNASQNEIVNMSRNAVRAFKDKKNADYLANKKVWAATDAETIPFSNVESRIYNAFGKGVNKEGFRMDSSAAKVQDAIREKIAEFKQTVGTNPTPVQLDEFKQGLFDYANPVVQSQTGRAVLTEAYNAVKDEISKLSPKYAESMKQTEAAIQKINEIEDTFKLAGKNNRVTNASIRSLQSATRNNAYTNYGQKVRLIDEMQKLSGEPLKEALAGQALDSIAPRGIGGLVSSGVAAGGMLSSNPQVIPMLIASSPRIAGELAYYGGKTGRAAEDLLSAPELLLPGKAAKTVGYASSLIEQLVNQQQYNNKTKQRERAK